MPGRKFSGGSEYRYGFNGKELDKEVAGTTTYDYGFRIYNPGLGRFLSVDPLFKSYPWYTPYQFAGNKPITCIDLDGLEEKDKVKFADINFTTSGEIWIGTITTAYIGKQKEALDLESTNPQKLAVLQQQSYNSVVAKVSEIVLRNFDPNIRWDLQPGYTDKIGADLASKEMLEGKEVSTYNSYTDYCTPGQLVKAGATIEPELTTTANALIVQFARDAVFNAGRNREAIERETDPNKKMALVSKMEEENHNAMVTFLVAAFSFAPEGTGSASNSKVSSRFRFFSSLRNAGDDLPTQVHHFATNKNSVWTPRMERIANKFGLDLDGDWNKAAMKHLGRHPNTYHQFVYNGMKRAAAEADGDKTKFLQLYDKYVKQPVLQNPNLLRKSGW